MTECGKPTVNPRLRPEAVSTSLPIVGAVALWGMAGYLRAGAVRAREAAPFALASVPAAFLARRFLAPLLPGDAVAYAFSALMLGVAWRMARAPVAPVAEEGPRRRLALVIPCAALVGALTGCLGVGGGFVIVPALVLLLGLRVEEAIGTSLLVIGSNCAASLLADHLGRGPPIRWDLVGVFGAVGIVGVVAGGRLSRRLPALAVRRIFAAVVVVMAVVMVVAQT